MNRGGMFSRIPEKLRENRNLLLFCVVSVFVWGMAAHGFAFSNLFWAHDALNEFDAAVFGNAWQIRLGRVLVPLYRAVFRTAATFPWLIGLLALAWLGLTLFLTAKLFRMQPGVLLFLAGGILAVNSTVIAQTATYINWLDENMFACLLAVLAVYFWRRSPAKGCLPGLLCVAGMLGLYQSYISTAITLILMLLILDLLEKADAAQVLRRGLWSLAMLAGGCAVYLGEVKLIQAATGQQMADEFNAVGQAFSLFETDFVRNTVKAWLIGGGRYLLDESVYGWLGLAVRGVLLLSIAGFLLIGLLDRQLRPEAKLLLVLLAGAMPLGMTLVYVLTDGKAHDLTYYAIWLLTLFALLLGRWFVQRTGRQHRCRVMVPVMLLAAVFLWDHVQLANMSYVERDMEADAAMAYYNRVLTRMEQQEAYQPGVTPVVLIGTPEEQLRIPEFAACSGGLVGMQYRVVPFAKVDYMGAYFRYVLQTPIALPEKEEWNRIQQSEFAQQMEAYPSPECIQMKDGVMLVKLGDRK